MWTKLRTLHKNKHDIILLQETKLKDADLNDHLRYRWRQISDGEAFSSPAASYQAGGVAILLSAYACSILDDRYLIPVHSDEHRQIIVGATLGNDPIYIHSIYAPVRRAERPHFFSNLTTPTLPGSHIIGGDFNCVLDTHLDTRGDRDIAAAGALELATWLTLIDAVDAWRLRHDHTREYTSPSGNSRIDMIFISGCFTNNYTADLLPRTAGSDHLAPQVTSASSSIPTGKSGHWQLPVWLCKKAAEHIKPSLERLVNATNSPNYHDTFTQTLKEITGKCKAKHKQTLRWRKNKTDRARLRWMRAHYQAIAAPTLENLADAEAARKQWISQIEHETTTKRAWAFDNQFAEAEKCTAFFLRRPSSRRATMIPGIKQPDGSVSNEPAVIHSEHKRFWTNLYSSDSSGTEPVPSDSNIENLLNIDIPRLPDEASELLEKEITEEDIERQIGRLPNNKAAGSDGIRAELLKQHPKHWAKILRPIFEHHIHQHRQLPQPFRETIITLIHKKGCTYQPKNYRPIALLNVIAKILTAIHNDRLRKVLHLVIPAEQTGFVPKRSISENIVLLQDAIYYAKRHHPSSVILSLDFEKAYDRVQWRVMKAILAKMNFGLRWTNTIFTMHKDRTAKLSINGDLS